MIRLLKRYLPTLIFAYIISIAFLYLIQDSLIFPGKYTAEEYVPQNAYLNNNIESLSFTTKEGTKLEGAFVNNKSSSLVIYFGGNSENVKSTMDILSKISSYDFISLNYRGFGKSAGEPSQQNIYSDALQIYEYFKERYKSISLIGRSLGTAAAVYVAANKKIDNLLLITPFDSVVNLAQDRYTVFPVKLILEHPFDSQKHMKNVTAPVSILMAKDDKVVPNTNTLNLKKDISNLKLFLVVEDTNHNKIIKNKKLIEFIKAALK